MAKQMSNNKLAAVVIRTFLDVETQFAKTIAIQANQNISLRKLSEFVCAETRRIYT